MKNNEEKMIIVEIKTDDGTACPLLDISNEMAPVCTLDNRVPYCKECRKGFSRAEAINKMSYALMLNGLEETDCKELAKAALDALLGKENENDRN